MLDKEGFDLWADGYDTTVRISDEEKKYPFAGYNGVLEIIFQNVMKQKDATVLDLGFGTGTLTAKLYKHGCNIYGQDFSSRMVELASAKMPDSHLYQGDFTQGLVEPLCHQNYDCIVATYSLHHLTNEQKIVFIHILQDYLKKSGKILIGDIVFENREELEQCRQAAGDDWDNEEIYFIADELRNIFPSLSYTRVSYCAGVLTITK